MKTNYRFWLALSVGGALLSAVSMAQTTAPGVMALTPSEMKWGGTGWLGTAGYGAIKLSWRSC